MKFRKLFILSIALMFLMTSGIALAAVQFGGPGWYEKQNGQGLEMQYFSGKGHPVGHSEWTLMEKQPPAPEGRADVYSFGEASKKAYDLSMSFTFWKGNWNDYGIAGGSAYSYGMNETTASAQGGYMKTSWKKVSCNDCRKGYRYEKVSTFVPFEARADSIVIARKPDIHAWSWAKDYGMLSKAGAGAVINGDWCDVSVIGIGFGLAGDPETTLTEVGIGGHIFQKNGAGETGWPEGTYAEGENKSELSFYANKYDQDIGQSGWFIIDLPGAFDITGGVEGSAIVKGKTEVRVQPYGSHRSAFATTQNSAEINFENYTGGIGGYGNVSAAAIKGGSFAAGAAGFGYNGINNGNGIATVDANLTPGTSSVHSSARATAE